MIILPKPTLEQLEKINKFALTPLTEDSCYVFPNLMIDNLPTSYYSIIQESLLRKFSQDVKSGVGLLLSHNNSKLPVGRSFDSTLVDEYNEETGEYIKTLYGDFYIALGRNTESGMTTDDIVMGIDSGTMSDTSIGFNANSWDCSICSHDIRSWNCSHYPGEKYVIEGKNENDPDTIETCYVLVGGDGQGELLENSLVYAGACNRASIVKQYSRGSVKEIGSASKLQVVDEIKNVPLDATMYQFYAKDGVVLMTDKEEHSEGAEVFKKRGGDKMELEKIITEYELGDVEGLKAALKAAKELTETLTVKETELEANKVTIEELSSQVEEVQGSLNTVTEELEEVKVVKEELTATNEELKLVNEELLSNKELVENYRKDLTEEVLTLGVRSQGNLFNKELYTKFLNTLSIEEVKEIRGNFKVEVEDKFAGVKVTRTKVADKDDNTEMYRSDFETDVEFRNHIADLALELTKKEDISITEATKAMYAKYTEKGDE